jgi:exodeoxyribonuclease VII small subunit
MVSEEIKNTKSPRFEEALSRLESILEAMETGEVPLDELVDKYEEGVSLLKTCNARLREAELKIEAVRKTNETIETEPFETDDS